MNAIVLCLIFVHMFSTHMYARTLVDLVHTKGCHAGLGDLGIVNYACLSVVAFGCVYLPLGLVNLPGLTKGGRCYGHRLKPRHSITSP